MTDASLTLHTRLDPMGPASALVLTDEQVAAMGSGKRAAVRVRIGDRTARLRLAVMGGQNLIGVSKAARAELEIELGDEVTAVITLDAEPREVVVPPELAAELSADPEAAAAFEKLAYTHRKEYAVWVGGAKRPETRVRRAAAAVEMVRAGRTRS